MVRIAVSILCLVLTQVHLPAADAGFTYSLNYTQVPARLNFKTLTLRVHVGTCVSCSARVDGAPALAVYLPASQQCQVQVPQGAILEVRAHSVSAAGTGAVTKCTLNGCKKWAYSFTWDDAWDSVLPNALPIFNAWGYRAGMAILTGPMGAPPYMSWDDLDQMFAAGWSVFNHSVTHPDITAANVNAELDPVRALIEARYPGYNNTHFVYPFNYINDWAAVKAKDYILTAEAQTGFNYADAWPPETSPPASYTGYGATNADSPWLLRRYQAYRDTPVSTWNAWLDAGHDNPRNTWVIAFSHKCTDTPGFYDCTPAQLNGHLEYLHDHYGAGGNDSVWMAPTDEVAAYIVTRERIIISPIAPVTPSRTPTLSPSFTVSPTFTPSPTLTPTPCGEVALHRVNSGGSAYTDGQGRLWSADQAWTTGAWGYVGGTADSAAVPIAGSTDDPLYQSERWGTPLEYRFSVPNGDYRLRLHFAEIYFTANGQRVFNVGLEGAPAISNLDIHAQAGANTALVLEREVTVSDGVLNVTAQASADAAKFSALEVIRLLPCATQTLTRTPTNSPSASATPSGSPTASPSSTPTLTPTGSVTASTTLSRSATPLASTPSMTLTSTPTATLTPTPTATLTSTPTGSTSASVTPSRSATPLASTVTVTLTPTQTVTLTPTPTTTLTSTTTGSPSASATPSRSATPEGAASTATATLTPTSPPLPVAPPSGLVKILNAVPVPNPNPRTIAFKLDGNAERVEMRLYSNAYVLLETRFLEGPWQAGWNQAALGADGLQGFSNGLIYAVLLPQPGKPEGQARTKLFIYR